MPSLIRLRVPLICHPKPLIRSRCHLSPTSCPYLVHLLSNSHPLLICLLSTSCLPLVCLSSTSCLLSPSSLIRYHHLLLISSTTILSHVPLPPPLICSGCPCLSSCMPLPLISCSHHHLSVIVLHHLSASHHHQTIASHLPTKLLPCCHLFTAIVSTCLLLLPSLVADCQDIAPSGTHRTLSKAPTWGIGTRGQFLPAATMVVMVVVVSHWR